jgi:hypothetical protein
VAWDKVVLLVAYSPLTGDLLGSFAITRREPGIPTPFHQALIDQFTHIASIAIERTRSEEALRRSEAFLAKAQRLSATASFSWRVATRRGHVVGGGLSHL